MPRSPLVARFAAAVLAAAVIASAAVAALLYAAGVAGGSTTAVVAKSTPSPAGSTAPRALNPSALYRGAAAGVVAIEASNDVSVLHVNPARLALQPLALGSTAALVAGDPLAVSRNPFGYDRSLSTGAVSGRDRTIQAPNGSLIAHALQTDAVKRGSATAKLTATLSSQASRATAG